MMKRLFFLCVGKVCLFYIGLARVAYISLFMHTMSSHLWVKIIKFFSRNFYLKSHVLLKAATVYCSVPMIENQVKEVLSTSIICRLGWLPLTLRSTRFSKVLGLSWSHSLTSWEAGALESGCQACFLRKIGRCWLHI